MKVLREGDAVKVRALELQFEQQQAFIGQLQQIRKADSASRQAEAAQHAGFESKVQKQLADVAAKLAAQQTALEMAKLGTGHRDAAARHPVEHGEAERRAMQARLTSLHTVNDKTLPIGYVRVPTLPEPVPHDSPLAAESAADDGHLHIIFSSGCNWAQHWESEMTMATAAIAGQRGRITRIVSGCHESSGAKGTGRRYHTSPAGKNDAIVPMEIMNRSANPNFGLFLTPPFDGATEFPWINKPTSIAYFMKHARPELDRVGETIIAVIDPDFLFLKTLTMVGKPEGEMALEKNFKWPSKTTGAPVDVPERGRPVSQRYGIEDGWISQFKVDQIVSPLSRALRWKGSQGSEDARKYLSVGPPMIHHVDDLQVLAPLWSKFMPKVLAQEKDILADMWAYAMASAELDLNHTTVVHHMLSSPDPEGDANFNVRLDKWIGKVTVSCADPEGTRAAWDGHPDQLPLPTFLHYASNFGAPVSGYPDEWMFHKGHIPSDILSCSTPYIKVAPDDTWEKSPNVCNSRDAPYIMCKISAFAMCTAIQKINQVLKLYKSKFCPAYETRHLIRLVQGKTRDAGCISNGDKADVWCWSVGKYATHSLRDSMVVPGTIDPPLAYSF